MDQKMNARPECTSADDIHIGKIQLPGTPRNVSTHNGDKR